VSPLGWSEDVDGRIMFRCLCCDFTVHWKCGAPSVVVHCVSCDAWYKPPAWVKQTRPLFDFQDAGSMVHNKPASDLARRYFVPAPLWQEARPDYECADVYERADVYKRSWLGFDRRIS
jgi:hypothetical protein